MSIVSTVWIALQAAEEVIRKSNNQSDFYLNNTFQQIGCLQIPRTTPFLPHSAFCEMKEVKDFCGFITASQRCWILNVLQCCDSDFRLQWLRVFGMSFPTKRQTQIQRQWQWLETCDFWDINYNFDTTEFMTGQLRVTFTFPSMLVFY